MLKSAALNIAVPEGHEVRYCEKPVEEKDYFFPKTGDETLPAATMTLNLLFLLAGKLPQRSSLWALSLSLSAVNLSQSARAKMSAAQLAEIYVTAATALRALLGHHLSFLPVRVASKMLL